jgi:hypothetical protein
VNRSKESEKVRLDMQVADQAVLRSEIIMLLVSALVECVFAFVYRVYPTK